jgi:hypothetical protein
MFEVYLNDRRDLLVLQKGCPMPLIGASGKWRRKKKVIKVSDEIRSAIEKHGYYLRKLNAINSAGLRLGDLARSNRDVQRLQHHQ